MYSLRSCTTSNDNGNTNGNIWLSPPPPAEQKMVIDIDGTQSILLLLLKNIWPPSPKSRQRRSDSFEQLEAAAFQGCSLRRVKQMWTFLRATVFTFLTREFRLRWSWQTGEPLSMICCQTSLRSQAFRCFAVKAQIEKRFGKNYTDTRKLQGINSTLFLCVQLKWHIPTYSSP